LLFRIVGSGERHLNKHLHKLSLSFSYAFVISTIGEIDIGAAKDFSYRRNDKSANFEGAKYNELMKTTNLD
jgi:hypothetical protein